MTRKLFVCAVGALAVLASQARPAAAQSQSKFEAGIGAAYPIQSQDMYMDEDLALRLRAGLRLAPRFWLFGVGERQDTVTAIPNTTPQGDATLTIYGISGLFEIRGEPQMELVATVGAGLGEIDVQNVSVAIPGQTEDTDLEYWWEVGAGAQFSIGPRFRLRLLLSVRQLSPKDPSLVLPSSKLDYLPSADFVFRF